MCRYAVVALGVICMWWAIRLTLLGLDLLILVDPSAGILVSVLASVGAVLLLAGMLGEVLLEVWR